MKTPVGIGTKQDTTQTMPSGDETLLTAAQLGSMPDWEQSLRSAFRSAGRRVEQARQAYRKGRGFDLPQEETGARIVCRRHAEKRTVEVDPKGRPACFDPDHPGCRGCAEDIREGRVETW